MGFPVCYSELLLPKLLIHFLSLFTLLRRLVSSLLRLAGLPDFLDSPPSSSSSSTADSSSSWSSDSYSYSPAAAAGDHSLSAALLCEVLPVVRLSDLPAPTESCCAVCLYDLEPHHEARRLPNCCHVFHRSCLDRWIGYSHRTCPLCRTSLVPDDLADTVNQGLWAASGFSDDFDLHFSNPLLGDDHTL